MNKQDALKAIEDISNSVFSIKFLDAAPPNQWLTSKRELINITDMGNGHLRNSINMLKRKKLIEHKKYEELLRETVRRGWSPDKSDFFLDGAL